MAEKGRVPLFLLRRFFCLTTHTPPCFNPRPIVSENVKKIKYGVSSIKYSGVSRIKFQILRSIKYQISNTTEYQISATRLFVTSVFSHSYRVATCFGAPVLNYDRWPNAMVLPGAAGGAQTAVTRARQGFRSFRRTYRRTRPAAPSERRASEIETRGVYRQRFTARARLPIHSARDAVLSSLA